MKSKIDRIEELGELLKSGAITKEEFNSLKKELLGPINKKEVVPDSKQSDFLYTVKRQDAYSRGALLLRTFFGLLYIGIPHYICFILLSIVSMIIGFIAFWAILFAGKYPKGMFKFQVGFRRWKLKVSAVLSNLIDGYPSFGFSDDGGGVTFDMKYPIKLSRGKLILRTLFGFLYVYVPHLICLIFVQIGASFTSMIAFWAILFTGKYPAGMHSFVVGVNRWWLRLGVYMANMTDTYPPFSTK